MPHVTISNKKCTGCHMRTYPVADQILEGTRPADSLEGIPAQVIGGRVSDGFIGQNFSSVKFSGIWCDFWAVDPNQLSQMIGLLWGKEWSEEDVMRLGERIWNLGRLFNLREGIETDTVPAKLLEPGSAFAEGPSAGKAIGRERFEQSLLEYYRLRGWDDNGVPTEARLAEVGVDVRL